VFHHLWARVLQDYNREYIYRSNQAGLQFDIGVSQNDIEFAWKGYTSTLFDFLMQTIESFHSLKKLDLDTLEQMFDDAKLCMIQEMDHIKSSVNKNVPVSLLGNELPTDKSEVVDYSFVQFSSQM